MKLYQVVVVSAIVGVATIGGVEAGTLSDRNYSIGVSLMKKPKLAVPYLSRAIKLDPHSAKAYLARGQAFLELGQQELALVDFNKAIMLKVEDPEVFFLRGRLYFEAGKPKLALNDFSAYAYKSTNANDKASGYRHMGKVYYDLEEYDKAIVELTRAVELQDNSSNFWLRGNAYFKQGRYKLAIDDFTTAIDQKDTDDVAKYYSCRARTYEKMGKDKLAKKDWHYVRENVKAGWGAFLDMDNK